MRGLLVCVTALLTVALMAAASRPVAARGLVLTDTGTLSFTAEVAGGYPATACPTATPVSVECFARAGTGVVRGSGPCKSLIPTS